MRKTQAGLLAEMEATRDEMQRFMKEGPSEEQLAHVSATMLSAMAKNRERADCAAIGGRRMTKEGLNEYLLETAKFWRRIFVECGGSIPQWLFLVRANGEIQGVLNGGATLHGTLCAELVRKIVRETGPVDAVALLSDIRMKTVSREEFRDMPPVQEGEISGDRSNPEAVMLCGRCPGYSAVVMMGYRRNGPVIVFEDDEPTITYSSDDKSGGFVLNLLPDDIWETVH